MGGYDLRGLNKEDHGGLIAWARSLAELGYFGVLDSEITCLETPVQFVEVAIVDASARTVFEAPLGSRAAA